MKKQLLTIGAVIFFLFGKIEIISTQSNTEGESSKFSISLNSNKV